MVDKFLKEGDEFYMVVYEGQTTPGFFGADIPVKTIREFRELYAVKKAWKDDANATFVLKKFRVREGQTLKVREGFIGEVLEDTPGSPLFGKTLKGGPKQWEFLDGWNNANVKHIELLENETKILK